MLRTGRTLLVLMIPLLLTCVIRAEDKTNSDGVKKETFDFQAFKNENATQFQKISEDLKALKKLNVERLDVQDQILARQATELNKIQNEMTEMRNQIRNLQDALRNSNPPRVARSIEPAPNTFGQIRMVNQLAVPVNITMDSTRYFLQAGEVRVVTRAAGPINYQVEAPGYYTGIYSRSTQVDANQQLSILVGP